MIGAGAGAILFTDKLVGTETQPDEISFAVTV